MTVLARLLADPAHLLGRAKAKAPEPLRLRRAVAAMSDGGGASIVADNTEVIQLRIAAAVRDGSAGLSRLSRRDLREGCRVFLHPPHPPGRSADIGTPLIELVVRLQRRAAYLALIDAYLDGFAVDDADVASLAAALVTTSRNWPWRPTDFWPERVKRFRLFEPAEAPGRLAAAVFGSDAPPRTIFDDAGLHSEGRRKGRLAEAAFRAACGQAANKVGRPAASMQERIVAWAQDGGVALAFPRAWPEFAAALFMPWRRDDPSASHRSVLIEAAVGYGGDPRVNEGRWRPVRQTVGDAYDVIVRWLTKASVEQFFDIVSETMTDRPDMWEQRRKFWTAYLKSDMISAAWVAFGADGAWRASQAARRSSDSGLSMFGRLSSGGGRSSEHAALIMRIGDLTVVEWSHNGRWNIWRRSDGGAPALFKHNSRGLPDYAPSDLMNAPVNGTHQGSWEWKLAETIRQETGLRP